MRVLRGLLGTLLWIVAALVGLVSLILCVTVILLPLGIPLFKLSKTLFGKSVRLMLPHAVAHPVKHAGKKSNKVKDKVKDKAKPQTPEVLQKAGKKGRKLGEEAAQASRQRRLGRPPPPGGRRGQEAEREARLRGQVSLWSMRPGKQREALATLIQAATTTTGRADEVRTGLSAWTDQRARGPTRRRRPLPGRGRGPQPWRRPGPRGCGPWARPGAGRRRSRCWSAPGATSASTSRSRSVRWFTAPGRRARWAPARP